MANPSFMSAALHLGEATRSADEHDGAQLDAAEVGQAGRLRVEQVALAGAPAAPRFDVDRQPLAERLRSPRAEQLTVDVPASTWRPVPGLAAVGRAASTSTAG